MARGINSVHLIGNVVADPVMKYSPSGTAIARLTLATNESKKQGDQWVDEAQYHQITLFGKTAEAVGQYVVKGQQLYVEGRIEYSKSEKNGVVRYFTNIICHKMNMIGGKGEAKPKDDPKPNTGFPPPLPDESTMVHSDGMEEEELPF